VQSSCFACTALKLACLERRWNGPVIVAAPGPSLNSDAAAACCGTPAIVVNDAYQLLPWADVLYGCDEEWWNVRKPEFAGEKWSSHNYGPRPKNDKRRAAKRFGLRIVEGRQAKGFALDPQYIHYGHNSGFQAVNLAIHWGGNPIILIGFDMRGTHFFGEYERPLRQMRKSFEGWIKNFREAAETLPPGLRIINATPKSALDCFEMMTLERALNETR
jgi:hypothetical protein